MGNDEVQDGGAAVVKADAASSPTDVAADKATEVSGDAQQKDEGNLIPCKRLKRSEPKLHMKTKMKMKMKKKMMKKKSRKTRWLI